MEDREAEIMMECMCESRVDGGKMCSNGGHITGRTRQSVWGREVSLTLWAHTHQTPSLHPAPSLRGLSVTTLHTPSPIPRSTHSNLFFFPCRLCAYVTNHSIQICLLHEPQQESVIVQVLQQLFRCGNFLGLSTSGSCRVYIHPATCLIQFHNSYALLKQYILLSLSLNLNITLYLNWILK